MGFYNNLAPLAQTFFIKKGVGKGENSIFVSKLELFFKKKSSIRGVSISLREVINGYPTGTIIPFSRTHLKSSEINVSEDASVATSFIFEVPVRLDVEKEYAFALEPDGGDPNFLLFTSKIGSDNISTGESVSQDWGDGVLFTSTNNRAWKPYQSEDVKFILYRRNFNANTGTIVLENNNHEFLSINNINGYFFENELIFCEKSANVSVTVTTDSTTISGTNLTDTYSQGDYILINGADGEDLLEIDTITSSTITTTGPASFTGTLVSNKVIKGNIVYFDPLEPTKVYLDKSNADGTMTFQIGDVIKGLDSGVQATITSVDDLEMSYIMPMIFKTNTSKSSVNVTGTFTDTSDATYTTTVPMNDKTQFYRSRTKIVSASNSTTNGKLKLNLTLDNKGYTTTTPFLDAEIASVDVYNYQITNDIDTTSAYVSKTVELSDDLDAETFMVFMTAHRPEGTDVKIYVRVQSSYDMTPFEDCPWVEMKYTSGGSTFTSASNLDDYREYKLEPVAIGGSVVNGINGSGIMQYQNVNGISFEGFKRFAVKIALTSSNGIGSVPFVADYRAIALT